MPAYEYTCPRCKIEETRYHVPIAEMNEQVCENEIRVIDKVDIKSVALGQGPAGTVQESHMEPCGVRLTRTEIVMTQRGRVDHRFQTQAIMTDGTKVDGHFGVEAKKNKGRF